MESIVPISLVDWPGKTSFTVFFDECNLRCTHCHNQYIMGYGGVNMLKICEELNKTLGLIDAFVMSGGEPTLFENPINNLSNYARSKGLSVGLHTNGQKPQVIKRLSRREKIDKYFIDYKIPENFPDNKRREYLGVDEYDIRYIIEYLVKSREDLEVRTTIFPNILNYNDVIQIAKELSEIDPEIEYVIQPGRINEIDQLSRKQLERLVIDMRKYLKNVRYRDSLGDFNAM